MKYQLFRLTIFNGFILTPQSKKVSDTSCSEVLETECSDVTETECRTMMVKECRWMKQKVCDGGETPRGYLPPRRSVRSRTWKTEKDPIGQLLEPLANIVHSLLEPIGKLLKQTGSSGRQPRCRMMPKQWCEETPKEWCEPTTKRICKDVSLSDRLRPCLGSHQ